MYRARFEIKKEEPKVLRFQKKANKLEKIIFTGTKKDPKILRVTGGLKVENN